MRIVYCGCGEFGIDSLEAIKNSSHELVGIITHPARPAGRGKKLRPTAVSQWGADNGMGVYELGDSNSDAGMAVLRELEPDLLVVIAFGQKISQEFIAIAAKGAINVHASLLPKYRGAAPINWAIINGEKQTGISIITLAEKMDAGEILAQARLDIPASSRASEVHDALAKLAGPVLVETIDKIAAGSAVYVKQDSSLASRAPKLKKADGFLDWGLSATELDNRIRGLWSWPGAQSDFVSATHGRCCRVMIAKSEVVSADDQGGKAGLLDEGLNVVCGHGRLKILEVKPQGKRLMDFKSFLNGRGGRAGDMFLSIEAGRS